MNALSLVNPLGHKPEVIYWLYAEFEPRAAFRCPGTMTDKRKLYKIALISRV